MASSLNTTSVCSYNFFRDQTTNALTANFADQKFEMVDDISGKAFVSTAFIIANDSGSDVQFSLDGVNIHGKVKAGEVLTFDLRHIRAIWLRGTGLAYRFWAW